MHDIWNPWHGCRKKSEGCEHCYMFFLDRMRDVDSLKITKTKAFRYPLEKDRKGNYKVQPGECIRVCMTSDFFLEEADPWRMEAFDIMRQRPDVKFFLLTKRPERVKEALPKDWGEGWENIMFNVTCENQKRAEERMPILLDLPFKHKGVMCAPFIGPVDLSPWLRSGQIEQVLCGGENYDGARPCHYEWVKQLSDACKENDVTFVFIETGTVFIKDGKEYHIPNKALQAQQAFRSHLSYLGREPVYHLTDTFLNPLEPEQTYVRHYRAVCKECGSRATCNGCSDCGRCASPIIDIKSSDGF